MKIDKQLILKLEDLAQLKLTPEERQQMQVDLEQILDMCGQLMEVDTQGVEPLIYPGAQRQQSREDRVGAMLSQEEALRNAPARKGPYFKVPKVI